MKQGLSILQKPHIVSGHRFDEAFCRVQLAKCNSEVVGIVEGIEQVLVERVDVLQPGEALEDGAELVREGLLGELDFAGVEG